MKQIKPGYYIVYWTADDSNVELAWYGPWGYGDEDETDFEWYQIGSEVPAKAVFMIVRKVRAKLPAPWSDYRREL